MQTKPSEIFEEYNKAKREKEALGQKGLYEQIKINERFYSGNQWYGANCGNDRPLVRHNIIKRIGDYKISQVLADEYDVSYYADSTATPGSKADYKELKDGIKKEGFGFSGEVGDFEINAVCEALTSHFKQTAERVELETLCARALKQAYITGSGILYTYFNADKKVGFDSFGTQVKGDIECELLSVRDVYFADAAQTNIQAQPYIIIAAKKEKQALISEAKQFGTEETISRATTDSDGKVLVLTKLFKTYVGGKTAVHCIKVTENGVLREEFDTRLRLYPLSVFRFGDNDSLVYGESEVEYLIPNQIAVNRMITASVWSNIASGMPMMVVNGDSVSGDISNEPGQIVKIYGTNEDVAGAVKFVSPPDISASFNLAINNLIENTLTQSGANLSSLGDERANNASAIEKLQTASIIPLKLLKSEYKAFLSNTAMIWADFWMGLYKNRRIKIEDGNGIWHFPFNAERYSGFDIFAAVKKSGREVFSSMQTLSALGDLYEKGIITKAQYISRLPDSLIPNKGELLLNIKENKNDT